MNLQACTFTVLHVPGGVEILLKETATGKVKRFFIGQPQAPLEPLIRHMESLTDDLALQWFKAERVVTKKPKKDGDESQQ